MMHWSMLVCESTVFILFSFFIGVGGATVRINSLSE